MLVEGVSIYMPDMNVVCNGVDPNYGLRHVAGHQPPHDLGLPCLSGERPREEDGLWRVSVDRDGGGDESSSADDAL